LSTQPSRGGSATIDSTCVGSAAGDAAATGGTAAAADAGSSGVGFFLKKLNMVLSVTGAATRGALGPSRYNFRLVAL
jgi:hypothetical protein